VLPADQISQRHQGCADGESCADAGDEDEVALFEMAFLAGGFHSKGNGAAGGVAEAVDVDDDFVIREGRGGRQCR